VELIVVAATPDGSAARLGARRPELHMLERPPGTRVPSLRGAGLRASRGEVVALLEDHLRPAPGWLDALRAHHAQAASRLAVGGAVDPVDTGRLVDWAAYFCEYGWHMSPVCEGAAALLTGANVSYKRAALEIFGELDAWETVWHARLRARGHELFRAADMAVLHERRFSVGPFVRERIAYGRDYAATRARGTTPGERIARAASAPLLPFVLATRLGASVFGKRHNRWKFVAALPWTLLFLAAWALGEGIGYVVGPRSGE
jgi:hypothetical protein